MSHSDLIRAGVQWLKKPWRNATPEGHATCSLVLTEMTTYARETPDVIGWSEGRSILIECKASRSDFLADAKKYPRRNVAEGMGAQRYYLAPSGLLHADELPDGWGFIEVKNGKVKVIKPSVRFVSNEHAEKLMLLSVIRRSKIKLT